MAVKRERGTSFLKAISDFAAKSEAIDLAMSVTRGAAFGTVAPFDVDDGSAIAGRIVVNLDSSDPFVASSNHTASKVPSLTVARGGGVAALATA